MTNVWKKMAAAALALSLAATAPAAGCYAKTKDTSKETSTSASKDTKSDDTSKKKDESKDDSKDNAKDTDPAQTTKTEKEKLTGVMAVEKKSSVTVVGYEENKVLLIPAKKSAQVTVKLTVPTGSAFQMDSAKVYLLTGKNTKARQVVEKDAKTSTITFKKKVSYFKSGQSYWVSATDEGENTCTSQKIKITVKDLYSGQQELALGSSLKISSIQKKVQKYYGVDMGALTVQLKDKKQTVLTAEKEAFKAASYGTADITIKGTQADKKVTFGTLTVKVVPESFTISLIDPKEPYSDIPYCTSRRLSISGVDASKLKNKDTAKSIKIEYKKGNAKKYTTLNTTPTLSKNKKDFVTGNLALRNDESYTFKVTVQYKDYGEGWSVTKKLW